MEISKDKLARIQQFVKDGRFKSVDEFVDRAVDMLLFAEDNKDTFLKSLRRE